MDLLNDRNALLGIVFGSVMVLSCAEIPSRSLCTTNTMCGSGYQCNFDTGQCVADGDDTLDEMNSREETQSDGRDDNSDDMQEDTASLPTDNLPVQCLTSRRSPTTKASHGCALKGAVSPWGMTMDPVTSSRRTR